MYHNLIFKQNTSQLSIVKIMILLVLEARLKFKIIEKMVYYKLSPLSFIFHFLFLKENSGKDKKRKDCTKGNSL